ncbi:scarecrow-like protein 9 [Corylus avellana]|uniref:scarecrow-like protein 9 n=1 Tax=Corylus avellana TaxID=13451 RepID=UPI00286C00A1|nr:scarecrow-like protein 9 [Corylus avellana]XP_059463236.1 scarecrow-like protein 9 [Corylus avellana]
MDPRLRGFLGSANGVQLGNQSFSVLANQNLVAGPRFENAFLDHNFRESHYLQPDEIALSSSEAQGDDSPEDCDFSDTVLGYITQILMEEDMEDKTCMLQDSLELQAAEKSLYDLLGKKYPPSPVHSTNYIDGNGESPDDNHYVSNYASSSNSSSCFGDSNLIRNQRDYSYTLHSQLQSLPLYTISQSPYSSSNSVISSLDGLVDSSSSSLQVPDTNSENQSVWQFRKGVEEATMFLPRGSELFFNLEANGLLFREPKARTSEVPVKVEKKEEGEYSSTGSRGKRQSYEEDGDTEDERRSKQAAVYIESTLRSKMFDTVLLLTKGQGWNHISELREALPNEISKTVLKNGIGKNVSQNGKSKGSNGGRGRGKKQSGIKEVVDLRTLLIHCAQAVAADDQRSANELLKQIRQHSSLFGDGNQRLAYCFADGLEARMAGTGSQIYKGLVSKRTSAADILKAYHLYLAACPFRKLSNFASNSMIMREAAKATRLHIIDFGILYGFQWPTLIQRLSWRDGGPPKLRITGIEFPQPGFRPAERVEETGRRLANYAESFGVPFEYNPIAKKWETIQLEELKIDKDEFLVVNCLYRGKSLHDESVSVKSSRDIVLNLIRKINPDIFIHGIVNGAFNAPFFVTRFREALFHYSALFDMLETLVPREDRERMLIEKEMFGREALNVIACEGWERMERPETYKQWQVRNLRAGFAQLPMDRDIVKKAMSKVRSSYHKDFVIDEDGRWLLQGWKGRIIYALSCWKPA